MRRTRKESLKRLATRPAPPTPKEVGEPWVTNELVFAMLLSETDFYYHRRVQRILEQAGLEVWRLKRNEVHPVFWVGWVRPWNVEISVDKTEASLQLRRIFVKAGLKIKAGELRVFDRRKNMIRFTFLFPWGSAGVLTDQGCTTT